MDNLRLVMGIWLIVVSVLLVLSLYETLCDLLHGRAQGLLVRFWWGPGLLLKRLLLQLLLVKKQICFQFVVDRIRTLLSLRLKLLILFARLLLRLIDRGGKQDSLLLLGVCIVIGVIKGLLLLCEIVGSLWLLSHVIWTVSLSAVLIRDGTLTSPKVIVIVALF